MGARAPCVHFCYKCVTPTLLRRVTLLRWLIVRRLGLRELSRVTGLPVSALRRARKGQALGDAKLLASSLGVTPSTVRRWARTGVPEKRVAAVAQILTDRTAIAKAERSERKHTEQLISKARQAGILKKAQPEGEKRFGGPKAAGKRSTFHLNEYLNKGALGRIEKMVSKAPRFPNYIVTVQAVEAGTTSKVRGYGGIFTQKLGKTAENIRFGTAITSGTWKTKSAAIYALFAKLHEAIRDAEALIYLTDLQVFGYEYKDTNQSRKLRRLKR